MSEIDFSRLSVLVADDFSNFRSTVISMLTKFGVYTADAVSNGREVVNACQKQSYDLILCDYELGEGSNGQQVLEELRHHKIISRATTFVIVSADTSRDSVMGAYDCEPDDYLMKPITAKMLEQRITRLVVQKKNLSGAYKSIESGDNKTAIAKLIDLSMGDCRNAVAAQKLLGELFLEEGEYNKAEKLYTKALEARQVDWARLGLARVKQLRGEHEQADEYLELILKESPLYLPAYDVMAENWKELGDNLKVQQAVQKSVSVSPKSILRQKHLAQIAETNGDIPTALNALRSTLRLGQTSCHANAEDNLSFARVAATAVEKNIEPAGSLNDEALEVLKQAKAKFRMNAEQETRAALIGCRNHALNGDVESARELLDEVGLDQTEESLDVSLDRVNALLALGEDERAEALLEKLLERYEFDQGALERIDLLLSEPVSENNRALITTINAEGIELYNNEQFDEAIECFSRVRVMFPKHIGVQLNIIQTLIGKIKSGFMDPSTKEQIDKDLAEIELQIESDHPQFDRFVRLKSLAAANLN